MSEKGCSCRSCLYHQVPSCSAVTSTLGFATIILSPIWITSIYTSKLYSSSSEEPKGLNRFLPHLTWTESIVLGSLFLLVTALGIKVLTLSKAKKAKKQAKASGDNSMEGGAEWETRSLTGSKKKDVQLALILAMTFSAFAVMTVILRSGYQEPAADPNTTFASMIPGVVGSYILYHHFRRNKFDLQSALGQLFSTFSALEKRSRQPVRTLFAPDTVSQQPRY